MKSETSEMYGERSISNGEILCFDNPSIGRDYEISIELPEFTCQCPFSGYPDFAVIKLLYQPFEKVLELKSLKLYINSYRNKKISHEEVANKILNDFVEAANPSWMQLEADFNPRGNIHTIIKASHGSRKKV
ncbi:MULTISPECIES: preQ(1) synthase [unclassified Prochlorococcus]|uniref:preQ(1) synthase n=1 Tax=unclassified Prochlorococcus TaxID=2627481 RepID=UPI00056BC209|nr:MULTISPECIES: preQ(1) synthase [unclassified Prochlorococcus]